MKHVIAIAAVAIGVVHGAAVARPDIHDVSTPFKDAIPPKRQALQALSQLFSYRLAGIADGPDELLLTCSNIEGMAKDKWQSIGLDPSVVGAPICANDQKAHNSTYAITNSMMAQSNLFIIHLLNSFNSTARFDTVCDNLRLDLLDYFPVIGNVVKEAVCKRSSYKQMSPQPFDSPPPVNTAAVANAKNTESTMFAFFLAAGLKTSSDLIAACTQASSYTQSLNKEQLNGTQVVRALCSVTDPITVVKAKYILRTWMTAYYITVLENASNVDGWLQWLCKNVDVAMMDAVGLTGVTVQQQFCTDDQFLNAGTGPAPSASASARI